MVFEAPASIPAETVINRVENGENVEANVMSHDAFFVTK